MGSSSRTEGEQEKKGKLVSKTLIVIPTYNNRKTLRDVVQKALSSGLPILVVNDGSTDGAIETISDAPVEILKQAKR